VNFDKKFPGMIQIDDVVGCFPGREKYTMIPGELGLVLQWQSVKIK
jgi:hypothetical protein